MMALAVLALLWSLFFHVGYQPTVTGSIVARNLETYEADLRAMPEATITTKTTSGNFVCVEDVDRRPDS
jgi:hypothetical protein